MNSEIYKNYTLKLLRIAVWSFKKYRIKRKIKNLKTKKWTEFLRRNLLQKYYKLIVEGTRVLAISNKDKKLKY